MKKIIIELKTSIIKVVLPHLEKSILINKLRFKIKKIYNILICRVQYCYITIVRGLFVGNNFKISLKCFIYLYNYIRVNNFNGLCIVYLYYVPGYSVTLQKIIVT